MAEQADRQLTVKKWNDSFILSKSEIEGIERIERIEGLKYPMAERSRSRRIEKLN